MCVAAPGRVVEIKDNIATVDYSGNLTKANAGVVNVAVGDYVLVHAGLIIQKISKSEGNGGAFLHTGGNGQCLT